MNPFRSPIEDVLRSNMQKHVRIIMGGFAPGGSASSVVRGGKPVDYRAFSGGSAGLYFDASNRAAQLVSPIEGLHSNVARYGTQLMGVLGTAQRTSSAGSSQLLFQMEHPYNSLGQAITHSFWEGASRAGSDPDRFRLITAQVSKGIRRWSVQRAIAGDSTVGAVDIGRVLNRSRRTILQFGDQGRRALDYSNAQLGFAKAMAGGQNIEKSFQALREKQFNILKEVLASEVTVGGRTYSGARGEIGLAGVKRGAPFLISNYSGNWQSGAPAMDSGFEVMLGAHSERSFLPEYADRLDDERHLQQYTWLRSPRYRTPGRAPIRLTPGTAPSLHNEYMADAIKLMNDPISHYYDKKIGGLADRSYPSGGIAASMDVGFIAGKDPEALAAHIMGEGGSLASSPEAYDVIGQITAPYTITLKGARGPRLGGRYSSHLRPGFAEGLGQDFLNEYKDEGFRFYQGSGRSVRELASRRAGRKIRVNTRGGVRKVDEGLVIGYERGRNGGYTAIMPKHPEDILESIRATDTGYKLQFRRGRAVLAEGTQAVIAGGRATVRGGPMAYKHFGTNIDFVTAGLKMDSPKMARQRWIEHYVGSIIDYDRSQVSATGIDTFGRVGKLGEALGLKSIKDQASGLPILVSPAEPTGRELYHDFASMVSPEFRGRMEQQLGLPSGYLMPERIGEPGTEGIRGFLNEAAYGKADQTGIPNIMAGATGSTNWIYKFRGQTILGRSSSRAVNPLRPGSNALRVRMRMAEKMSMQMSGLGTAEGLAASTNIQRAMKKVGRRSRQTLYAATAPIGYEGAIGRAMAKSNGSSSMIPSSGIGRIYRVSEGKLAHKGLYEEWREARKLNRGISTELLERTMTHFGVSQKQMRKALGFYVDLNRQIPLMVDRKARLGKMTNTIFLPTPYEAARILKTESPTGLAGGIAHSFSPYNEAIWQDGELVGVQRGQKGSISVAGNTMQVMEHLLNPTKSASQRQDFIERASLVGMGMIEAQVGTQGILRKGIVQGFKGGSGISQAMPGEGLYAEVSESWVKRNFKGKHAEELLGRLRKEESIYSTLFREPVQGPGQQGRQARSPGIGDRCKGWPASGSR